MSRCASPGFSHLRPGDKALWRKGAGSSSVAMDKVALICVALCCSASVSCFPTASTETCVPGTSFLHSDNCNSCFCPESGLKSEAGCTEMACVDLTTLPVSRETCVPGSSFPHSDNCNTCICPESGLRSRAACTAKACLNRKLTDPVHHSSESSESSEHRATRDTSATCVPGTSFMDSENCNSCFCPPSGLKSEAGCTLKLCLNRTSPVHVQHSSESSESSETRTARDASATCVPGTSFKDSDNCNSCFCPPSGLKAEAGCTMKLCPNGTNPVHVHSSESSESSDHRTARVHVQSSESSDSSDHRAARDTSATCVPGTSFMDDEGCNRCFCPPSGLKSQAGCTLKYCFKGPIPGAPTQSPESNDSSDERTKRDTNVSGETSDESCVEGDKWIAEDGCNQCWCPLSGKTSEASCTKMACIPPDNDSSKGKLQQ